MMLEAYLSYLSFYIYFNKLNQISPASAQDDDTILDSEYPLVLWSIFLFFYQIYHQTYIFNEMQYNDSFTQTRHLRPLLFDNEASLCRHESH